MFNIGPQELLLIILVALVVVGPRRLPELGRTIGKGLREVRKAQDEVRRTVRDTIAEEERPTFRSAPSPRTADPATGGGEAAGEDARADGDPQDAVSDVREISRTLGQSLSELRRAREDIRRSLRVDPEPASPPATGRRGARARAEGTPAAPGEPAGSEGEETASGTPVGPESAPSPEPPEE
jgi:Tat protein translocase TatB subunit